MINGNSAFTTRYNRHVNELDSTVELLDEKGNTLRTVQAVWDTGATNSVIRAALAQEMNLPVVSYVEQSTANGKCTVPVYIVRLQLPNNVKFVVTVTGSNISDSIDMLIGMDVIGLGDFTVSNPNGKTTLSFVFPSLGEVDYVSIVDTLNKTTTKNVGRNAPCPCGSAKKYKNCHGK